MTILDQHRPFAETPDPDDGWHMPPPDDPDWEIPHTIGCTKDEALREDGDGD